MDVAIIVMIVILVLALFAVTGFYVDEKERVTKKRIKKYRDTVLKHIGNEQESVVPEKVENLEEENRINQNVMEDSHGMNEAIVVPESEEFKEESSVDSKLDYSSENREDLEKKEIFEEKNIPITENEQTAINDIENREELMINEPLSMIEEPIRENGSFETGEFKQRESQIELPSQFEPEMATVELSNLEEQIEKTVEKYTEENVESFESVEEENLDIEEQPVEEYPEESVELFESVEEENLDTEEQPVEEYSEENVEPFESVEEASLDTEEQPVEEYVEENAEPFESVEEESLGTEEQPVEEYVEENAEPFETVEEASLDIEEQPVEEYVEENAEPFESVEEASLDTEEPPVEEYAEENKDSAINDLNSFDADELILEGIPKMEIPSTTSEIEEDLFSPENTDTLKEPFSYEDFTLDNIPYMEPINFSTTDINSQNVANELTNSVGDLVLDNQTEIDREFEKFLQEEDDELKQQFSSLNSEKKEEFKSLDDEDEDLWSF